MVLSPFCVHSFTGNYTDTLDDAKTAVGLRPSFLKAFVRGMLAIVPSSKFSVESRVGGGGSGGGVVGVLIPPIYLTHQVLSQLAAMKLKQLPLNGPALSQTTSISWLRNRTWLFMLSINRGT